MSWEEWLIAFCLLATAGLAWWWLFGQAAAVKDAVAMAAMPGMAPMEPPVLASYLPPAVLMWVLMMVAMMLPSVAPTVLVYARFARVRQGRPLEMGPILLIASVYLLVWGGFALLAALAQYALVKAGAVSAVALTLGERRIAAGLLIAAGLYQLSPSKAYCLKTCRSPLPFVVRFWQPGWRGGVAVGLHHAVHCLGCCWLLMALLFVGGVMSLVWVGALALLVLAEKVGPGGPRVAGTAGLIALLIGASLLTPLGGAIWPLAPT